MFLFAVFLNKNVLLPHFLILIINELYVKFSAKIGVDGTLTF